MRGSRRRVGLVATTMLMSALLGACSSGASAPGSSTPAAPSPSLPSASADGSAPPVSPSPIASPSVADAVFGSPFYLYTIALPPEATSITPEPAGRAWDGAEQIDSGGPLTDKFWLPDGRLVFVYGGPTTEALAEYAQARYLESAGWHDCPTEPKSSSEAILGGEPARMIGFDCQGVHVLKLMAVHDGTGLVVNQMAPQRDDAADEAALLDFVRTLTWSD